MQQLFIIATKSKIKYFDFISESLCHDTEFVSDCLQKLFALEDWTSLNIDKSIHFWMDNGPQHFRTYEWLHAW